MATVDAEGALAQLSGMVAASTPPELSTEDLQKLLPYAAVADAQGREPAHPDWTPTYDLWLLRDSAAEGWRRKAALASSMVDVTADGAAVKRSQVVSSALTMAASFSRAEAGQVDTSAPMIGAGGVGRARGALPVGNGPEVDCDDAAGTWPGYGGAAWA